MDLIPEPLHFESASHLVVHAVADNFLFGDNDHHVPVRIRVVGIGLVARDQGIGRVRDALPFDEAVGNQLDSEGMDSVAWSMRGNGCYDRPVIALGDSCRKDWQKA